MIENVNHEISMNQYLLGELTEDDQQQLEKRLMNSNECFEQLLIAEDELVDEYLLGTLSPREQEKFNDHFLCTPDRREKLQFSRSLQRYVSANANRPRTARAWLSFFDFLWAPYPIRGWSMAAALLSVVLGGSWLTVRIQLLQQGLEQVRKQPMVPAAEQEESQQLAQLRERNDQLARERAALEQELATLKTLTPQHPLPSSMVAFALTPGLVRDMEGMKKLVIPTGANWVQLQLDLGSGDYKIFQAVLQRVEGDEIWTQSTPKMRMRNSIEVVVLTLPAKLLPHGDYVLKLSGLTASGNPEDIGKYYFRALEKQSLQDAVLSPHRSRK